MSGEDDKPAEPFDARAASAQLPAAEAALLAMASARREAAGAETTRQFAVKCVRALEPIIIDLFHAGTPPNAVLNILQQHIPAVAPADLRHALALVRERYRLNNTRAPQQIAPKQAAPKPNRADTAKPSTKRPAVPQPAQPTAQADPGSRARTHPTLPNVELPDWADWSDQMPGESDADYIFRKALEMPPETQRKFIGEHNR